MILRADVHFDKGLIHYAELSHYIFEDIKGY